MATNVVSKNLKGGGSTPGNRVVYHVYDAWHVYDVCNVSRFKCFVKMIYQLFQIRCIERSILYQV